MAVEHPVRLPRGNEQRGECPGEVSGTKQPAAELSTLQPSQSSSVRRMSESSPADLAIAFRSFTRRLHDALAPVHGDTSVASAQLKELQAVVERASAVVGSSASVSAIADSIESKPGPAWSDAQVALLRACALDGGKLLRSVERAAEDAAAARS
jgi:hypothetical protein